MGTGNYGGFGNTEGDKKHELLNKLALNLKGISNKIKTNNINSNVKAMKSKYPVNKYGYFGEKGSSRDKRIVITDSPIIEAKKFFKMIISGYVFKETIGTRTTAMLSDNTIITIRINTKTSPTGKSPAVEIVIKRPKVLSKIPRQKIHFQKEKKYEANI